MKKKSILEGACFVLAFGLCSYVMKYLLKRTACLEVPDFLVISFLADLTKTGISYAWSSRRERRAAVYTPKYLVVGGLSVLHTVAWLITYHRLPSLLEQLISQFKPFYVFVLSAALLKREYSALQKATQVFLLGSLAGPLIYEMAYCKEDLVVEGLTWMSALMMLVALTSAFSGIYFEKKIKRTVASQGMNSFFYSGSSGALTAVFIAGAVLLGQIRLTAEKSLNIALMTGIFAVDGIISSIIMVRHSTLFKSLLSIFCHGVTSVIITVQMKEALTPSRIISLVLSSAAIGMFTYLSHQRHQLPREESCGSPPMDVQSAEFSSVAVGDSDGKAAPDRQ